MLYFIHTFYGFIFQRPNVCDFGHQHEREWTLHQRSISVLFFNTDQISDTQVHFKLRRHWKMLHCQKEGVDDEADDDPEVEERVHDDGVVPLFEPTPAATTVPLQEAVSQDGATWTTRPLAPELWNVQLTVKATHLMCLYMPELVLSKNNNRTIHKNGFWTSGEFFTTIPLMVTGQTWTLPEIPYHVSIIYSCTYLYYCLLSSFQVVDRGSWVAYHLFT